LICLFITQMKKNVSYLILIALIAFQCKKPDSASQLPPITTTGANTFGCLVNGNVWLPYYEGWSTQINALAITAETKNYAFNEVQIFAADTKQSENSRLYLTIDGIKDTGYYHISNYLNEGMVFFSTDNEQFEPFDTFGLVHIIKCDTINKIISGTFSFIGYTDPNHTIAKTASITDGRFDMHYPLIMHFKTN
jgi:hypothetical protein